MEDLRYLATRTPSLSALARSQGKDKPMQLVPCWLQELPEGLETQNKPSIELRSRFLLGFNPPSFCHFHDIRKATKVFCQSLPSLTLLLFLLLFLSFLVPPTTTFAVAKKLVPIQIFFYIRPVPLNRLNYLHTYLFIYLFCYLSFN